MENMTADLRNYRSLAESHRKSLEEKKDYVHGLQRNMDKLTYENEKLKEERDRYHQESFELKDRCQGLTEELEQSRNESRELREQAEAADGTSENRSFPNQGHFPNLFTSTPAGPPNVSFQGPGFFAHGTGIPGSRRN
ncbi:uncharacterized protein LOC134264671 [Saccostrea cucullata]|uniref:uncharacterized protein LOC134264671 n=1 Tax=Saccostrea cuccullata TaxID=36930 RepID=UPI002ED03711